MKKTKLLFLLIITSASVWGQKKIQSLKSGRVGLIKAYTTDGNNPNAPNYILDSLVEGYQKGLSGSLVKEGKLAGSSLSITEKGASIQVSFPEFSIKKVGDFYLGLTASGSGTDKFISVVKDGKYQNNFSTGGVINYFPRSAVGYFKSSDALQTRVIVSKYVSDYENLEGKCKDPFDCQKELAYINSAIKNLLSYEEFLSQYESDEVNRQNQKKFTDSKKNADNALLIIDGRIARDTLIALKILPKKYLDETDIDTRISMIPDTLSNQTELREKKYLAVVEKELMNAKWNAIRLNWWTLKPSFNVTPYKMINPEKPDDNYADTYNDNFFSVSLSYNLTIRNALRKQFQFTLSPTVSLFNSLDFSGLKEQTINKIQETPLNDVIVNEVLFSTTGYKEKPDRDWGWSVELPFVFFWNKVNLGFEVAGRVGENNPKKDNFGGRLGVYIPIEIKEGTPIWIEPIIKVGKLGNSKETKNGIEPLSFWKDNFEFGFNLSIAIPGYKMFAKK